MAEKTSRTATVRYTWVYPKTDDRGDTLVEVQGAWIEVRRPGESEFERITFVEFPKSEVSLEFAEDGAYAIRHRVVGSCTLSDPSEAVAARVNRRPPATPDSGSVTVPCAHAEGNRYHGGGEN